MEEIVGAGAGVLPKGMGDEGCGNGGAVSHAGRPAVFDLRGGDADASDLTDDAIPDESGVNAIVPGRFHGAGIDKRV